MDTFTDIYGKPWTESEYIIVLNAFYKHRGTPCHEKAPFIRRLSNLLRRTPDSLVMRCANFASLTSGSKQPRGLDHIGPAGRRAFKEWDNLEALDKCAAFCERQLEQERCGSLFAPETVNPLFLGRYQIDEEWRQGGFATVYTCHRHEDGKRFALKVLRTNTMQDHDALPRFRREIRLLKQVLHVNIIRLYEDSLDSAPSHPGYVMDLADYSLKDHIEGVAQKSHLFGTEVTRPALEMPAAAMVFRSVAAAAEALHQNNIPVIHRDINPNNVLFVSGQGWVLSDFGLAAFMSRSPATSTFATNTGPGMGTAHYTAPEQWRDLRAASVVSDVYSLGVLIWELFSTETLFRMDHLGLPSWVEPVVRRAVAYKSDNRFEAVGALREAFDSASEQRFRQT